MKAKVSELSKRLMALHRHFLDKERIEAEKQLERSLSPFEYLHLLTQDPGFTWQQPFSSLLTDVDILVDEAESISEKDVLEIQNQVEFVISKANSKLTERYKHYLDHDGEFVILHMQMKLALGKLLNVDELKTAPPAQVSVTTTDESGGKSSDS